jgi:hypothetical protein
VDLLVGTAWGAPGDLSPNTDWIVRQGVCYLPRTRLFTGSITAADGTVTPDPADPGALLFGQPDLRPAPRIPGTANAVTVAIDAVSTGVYGERWRRYVNPIADEQARIMRFITTGGTIAYQLPADATALGMVMWASVPMFKNDNGNMGLIRMGDEVFAWRRCIAAEESFLASAVTGFIDYPTEKALVFPDAGAPRHSSEFLATIVGRGLLGSEPAAQTIIPAATLTANGNRPEKAAFAGNTLSVDGLPHYTGLPALTLPVGPVGILSDPVPDPLVSSPTATTESTNLDNNQPPGFRFSNGVQRFGNGADGSIAWNAPAFSVWNAEGSGSFEVIGLGPVPTWPAKIPPANTADEPRFQRWRSAAWLRGMYGTQVGLWKPAASAVGTPHAPIVIGWWPRYASALPATATEQHYRSRHYAWAGFPARFHRMRVDGSAMVFAKGATGNDPAALRGPGDYAYELLAGTATATAGPEWLNAAVATSSGQVSLGSGMTIDDRAFGAGAINGLFTGMPFREANGSLPPVDGLEMRVVWHYPATISGTPAERMTALAANANRPVRIDPVRLRVRAPATVISTEER